MLPALLSKIGLPVLTTILTETLKTIDTPATKTAAEALDKVSETIRNGGVTPAQIVEANRHAERMAEIAVQERSAEIAEINQSLRAEIASADTYVRRMRPTFGYLMAITWAAQMLGLAYVIVFDTDRAGFVLQAMGNLSAIWAVGLSVLGIYVYKRSEEKTASADSMIFWNGARRTS